ncbi:hypothetical protein AD949_10570 [Acetobacter orleanensis]|nr:hypothetical protein AD949_10570 [Acetobacter orleanensis]
MSVSAPAQLVALALLADLKADLGIADSAQDGRLNSLILDASGLVLDYIGRPVLDASWRDVIDIRPGDARLSLMLGIWPVTKITAFGVHGAAPFTPDQISNLDIMHDSGIVYPPASGPALWPPGRYIVTYQAGYIAPVVEGGAVVEAGTIPRAMSSAVLIAAKAAWHAADRDPSLRSESEQGTGSSSWVAAASGAGGLPQEAADRISRYRSGGLR